MWQYRRKWLNKCIRVMRTYFIEIKCGYWSQIFQDPTFLRTGVTRCLEIILCDLVLLQGFSITIIIMFRNFMFHYFSKILASLFVPLDFSIMHLCVIIKLINITFRDRVRPVIDDWTMITWYYYYYYYCKSVRRHRWTTYITWLFYHSTVIISVTLRFQTTTTTFGNNK